MDTLFVGQNIIHLNSVDSTNSFLSDLSNNENIVEGTLVVAKDQYKGRGQMGNVWQSEPHKSLTFSLLFLPRLELNYQFFFNKCISLAICEALKKCHVHALIKWPNDIIINNKKVAGVLIENTVQNKIITKTVVGIGINVNNEGLNLSSATSLKMATSTTFDINDLLKILCQEIEKHYLLLLNNKKIINSNYNVLLFNKNILSEFIKDGKNVKGIVRDVDDFGRLGVDIDGKTDYFSWGELRFNFF